MHRLLLSSICSLLAGAAQGLNSPFESAQLSSSDIGDFSAVDFGDRRHPNRHHAECRAFPGSEDWPSEHEWSRLNYTMDGALLKPTPVGEACYPGPLYDEKRCRYLLSPVAKNSHFYIDDPLTTLTQWTEGGTCMASLKPQGNCTQGGFPVYVANVTTVKQVQAAVNFARNKNIRLVIKNTGHDFGGRNVGAGSLSIWTHYLKDFEFLPSYTKGPYTGMAVRYGAGLETWELYNHMAANNISTCAAGIGTVGAGGGWFGYGGHGYLTSFYGLGADQALSIDVVTADGRFVTADPYKNKDLFFAIRGGGGSTWGVVISVVMKAFPPLNTTSSALAFQVMPKPAVNVTSSWNDTKPGNGTARPFNGNVDSVDTFWKGVSLYLRFSRKIVDAGGLGFNYVYPLGGNSFSFTTTSTFPNKTSEEVVAFMQPLYDELAAAGIPAVNPPHPLPQLFGSRRERPGESPGNTRYRSRFFPRRLWDDDKLWQKGMDSIRAAVEAGYDFHGNCQGPTREIAGWPGRDNAVNPAWRRTAMHAMLMTTQPTGLTAQAAEDEDLRIKKYMDVWRELMPESGSYMNEGDPGEPNWQHTYYGHNYPRLLDIKHDTDPWGVFWAPTTVGSEEWEVRVVDGYPNSQNGRLCRAEASWDDEGDGDDDDDDDDDNSGDDGDDGGEWGDDHDDGDDGDDEDKEN